MQAGNYKFTLYYNVEFGYYYKKWGKHIPVGSTSLESLTASDVARSWLAGVMAKMRQFGYRERTRYWSVERGTETKLIKNLKMKFQNFNMDLASPT